MTQPRDSDGMLLFPKYPCCKDETYLCKIRHEPGHMECLSEPRNCWCKKKKEQKDGI